MPTRQSICSIVITLALLIVGLTSSAWAADRKVIGIADFTDTTVASGLAPMITSLLSEDIVTNRSFYLLNQPTLLERLSRAGLSTNLYEKSRYLQPEQLDGIHFLVAGAIKEADTQIVQLNGFQQHRARVLLTVRIVHVPAAQVVYAETSLGEARQTFLLDRRETDAEASANRKALLEIAAKRALTRVSTKLHSLNPMTGVVIKVNPTDNTLLIDLGSEQGVAVDQTFLVYQPGAMLVHPVTSLEIGRAVKEIATIRIAKIDTLSATAVVVKGQISEITAGLLVKKLPHP